jgi:MFS superfamily sulfate permease-like transporter
MNKNYFNSADLLSGFFVSLLALPLCLGIANASGFPPVAGLFTAILGGMLTSVLGGAKLTIKGPAAGLIVIVLGAVQELQVNGDMLVGYKRALAVGVVAGILQIIFSRLKFSKFVNLIPGSVIHGMLAAIGIIIISKQIHILLGVSVPSGKSPVELIGLIPESLKNLNPEIALIGLGSLVLMLLSTKITKLRFSKYLPIPLVIVSLAIIMSLQFDIKNEHSYLFLGNIYNLNNNYLINIPSSLISSIQYPDFSVITSFTSIKYIILFALVGSIESLLTVSAIDEISKSELPSNHDKDLMVTGIANTLVSFIGGMPMISEVARSKANLDAGAKTSLSNFVHGLLLLFYVVVLGPLLSLLPLSALAGMLVYVGLRLASPSEFRHMWHVGPEQFAFFTLTCVLTVTEDLLLGVVSGMALAYIFSAFYAKSFTKVFKLNTKEENLGNKVLVRLEDTATFLNARKFADYLSCKLEQSNDVEVDFSNCKLVEHSFIASISKSNVIPKGANFSCTGLDKHKLYSKHPECTRRLRA